MSFRLAYLYLTWPILMVKVIHILTVNILQRVKDMGNITIAIKYKITCVLLIGISTFNLYPL